MQIIERLYIQIFYIVQAIKMLTKSNENRVLITYSIHESI